MSMHITISPTEAAVRLAIRELIEAYAHCADRRDAKGQMALSISVTDSQDNFSVGVTRLTELLQTHSQFEE